MQKYELTVVLDSLQKSEGMEKIITKTETFIKNNGGEVQHVDEWGKKRLAYEINRKQYGHYYQIFFEAPGTVPALLERELRLDETVLRFLNLQSDYNPEDFTEKVEASAVEERPIETKEPSSNSEDSKKDEEPVAVEESSASEDSSDKKEPVAVEESSTSEETKKED